MIRSKYSNCINHQSSKNRSEPN